MFFQSIFSSGKSIESIVLGLLHDQGLFQYEDKVIQHWPEFGQNGKEDVRICDVLRHQSGLAWFTQSIESIQDAWTDNLKLNKIGHVIESQSLHFPASSTTRTEYHALTRGLILNEIVRRIDPKVRYQKIKYSLIQFQSFDKGRTMGEILRQDIAMEGILLAPTDEELKELCVQYKVMSPLFIAQQVLMPWWFGKKIDLTLLQVIRIAMFLIPTIFGSSGQSRPRTFKELDTQSIAEFYNSNEFKTAQVSSAGIQASAKGLAKLASVMATKGQGLMSESTWTTMHSKAELDVFGQMPNGVLRSNFTIGGLNSFQLPENPLNEMEDKFYSNRHGFYGWFGLGGSIMQWNPELKIGFAFVPSMLNITDLSNHRGSVLQKLVTECCMKSK